MRNLPSFPVELYRRQDKYENSFHVGKCKAPLLLDFSNGVVFFAFLSNEGEEMLNIACPKPESHLYRLKKSVKNGRLEKVYIKLVKKVDSDGNPYFIGMVKDNDLVINLREGWVFMVFSSVHGEEEIQIMRNLESVKSESREDELDSDEIEYETSDLRNAS